MYTNLLQVAPMSEHSPSQNSKLNSTKSESQTSQSQLDDQFYAVIRIHDMKKMQIDYTSRQPTAILGVRINWRQGITSAYNKDVRKSTREEFENKLDSTKQKYSSNIQLHMLDAENKF